MHVRFVKRSEQGAGEGEHATWSCMEWRCFVIGQLGEWSSLRTELVINSVLFDRFSMNRVKSGMNICVFAIYRPFEQLHFDLRRATGAFHVLDTLL